ncbi:RNA polymerase sigma factor [Pseudomarimonas arenosa]|uniref:Sigma-70 family RNA polymerase sigma factor n=1 Tax=Pseudomarimonas arenosa TaxID=2774145 RepID=A0AAW3ZR63_9GAMM|nr:sigma-70 family RNA polymerase sigma factor [Pseudomarimonas arenosa]MBD8527959.1 sigma-70 family RNA polymerase sigma factor [Pseudomarimonas arenosa]
MSKDAGFGQDIEAAVLARAQRGDSQALESIYRMYARAAYLTALQMTGRPSNAEDAVHDAFIRAFERLSSFRGDAPFGAWLKRLLINVVIDRLRIERRWFGSEVLDEQVLSEETHSAEQIDAQALLAQLTPRARSVVWLHQVEGLSHPEIAHMFKQSESWSKSLLARSLSRLRQHAQESAA